MMHVVEDGPAPDLLGRLAKSGLDDPDMHFAHVHTP